MPPSKPKLSLNAETSLSASVQEVSFVAPLPGRKPALRDDIVAVENPEQTKQILAAVVTSDDDVEVLSSKQVSSNPKTQWDAALDAWRVGSYKEAHGLFAALAKGNGVNQWTRSGAAFWAARSADRMGERRVAKGYLKLAAQEQQTFYGQLAAQIIRQEPMLAFGRFKTLSTELQQDMRGDKALVHAIIMQESRFNGKATSKMGARGLMQVMPATARHIEGRSFKGVEQLYNESYNVQVGSRYVQMLAGSATVQGRPHLLLAAYNGGPANLDKWLRNMPEEVRADDLLVIETYPSGETRAFVERVMANMWVYERLLNKRTSPSLVQLAKNF